MEKPPPSNVTLGCDPMIEPGVTLGFAYHPDAGATRMGDHAICRTGTIIYGDVSIGDHFQSGHHTVIRAKVRIGNYCTVSNNSTIEGLVRMGDGVRIMSHVYIPTRTWFGDRVFVGPGVTFLNAKFPGREGTPTTPQGATIEDHVVIGGGCTILPGVRIGARSFVAAGAVVTCDVPPASLVVGVPGRIKPLPEHLNRENDESLCIQPLDLWHPHAPDITSLDWPASWGESYADASSRDQL